MRVIVISSTFKGGSEAEVPRFVDDQIIHLKRHYPQLEFHVLVPHFGKALSYEVHQEYTEYRFHYFWPYRFETLVGKGILPAINENRFRILLVPFFFWFEFWALWKLCRKIKPAVIYAHWFTPQGINAGLVSLLTGVPFAFMNHAFDVCILAKIPWLGKRMVRFFSKRALAITVSGTAILEKYKTCFGEKDFEKLNIGIISMGIDFSQFNHVLVDKDILKVKYNLSHIKVILYLGRLAEIKGILDLLQAFEIAQRHHSDIKLVIAGEGQQKEQLVQFADQLNISNKVVFTGFLAGDKKMDYLILSEILVIPSIILQTGQSEGLPVTLMEGLAAGKLIIATYESNAGQLINNGENGFLIHQKDPLAMAEIIEKIANMDDTEKNAVMQRARETAQAFDWNVIAKRHFDFVFDKLDSIR